MPGVRFLLSSYATCSPKAILLVVALVACVTRAPRVIRGLSVVLGSSPASAGMA
uniref:Uncharacterized protein n=1 Tax=uncultured bacterium Pu8 TaxID=139003 RepID=Q99IY3_9BACT|nr:unknown [uncultured bacterium Pu8]